MKIFEINSCRGGSTGGIMEGIAALARKNGIEAVTASPRSRDTLGMKNTEGHYFFGPWLSVAASSRIAYITGYDGKAARMATHSLIRKIENVSPDIIHLHNLHNSVINLPIFFGWLKKARIKTVWTLHDCWAFTGHCPYFCMADCRKWEKGCGDCPQYGEYPAASRDRSAELFEMKKRLYGDGLDITFVCPSRWLAGELEKSFLCAYPSRVIYNGIDLSVFRAEGEARREEGRYTVLGVASPWSRRKGIDIFARLPELLGEKYRVVAVGTDEYTEKELPESIIKIRRTESREALAAIYRGADVFANPTRDEVLGLVNAEANACGIPVVTFDSGGSPECIDEKSGIAVARDDISAFAAAIKNACENKIFKKSDCVGNARRFDGDARFAEYIELYGDLYNE